MGTITTSVSGTTVTFTIYTDPAKDPTNWGVYIYAQTDRHLGVGGTDSQYPYYVEEFHGSGFLTQTVIRTEIVDNYVAILALQGLGEVDYSYFSVIPPCVPDWRCQTPLNGYEHDFNNCGQSDRLNSACNPPPTQHKYRCINNVCTQDDVNGTYTENTCGGTCVSPPPTIGCTNCDLTTSYCIAGQCIPKLYIYGAFGLIALSMFMKK